LCGRFRRFDDYSMSVNPCLNCGACCAFYRVSFYWAEAEPFLGGTIPTELTERLTPHRSMMRGTGDKPPKARCVALQGEIGAQVSCSIYPQRGSVCREFAPAWENGVPNERCDKARAYYGLPPLEPDWWQRPDGPESTPPVRVA